MTSTERTSSLERIVLASLFISRTHLEKKSQSGASSVDPMWQEAEAAEWPPARRLELRKSTVCDRFRHFVPVFKVVSAFPT